jgi:hypothetical protein
MNRLAECVRCHVQMQFGFVLDAGHDGFAPQTSSPGEPEPSFWMGLMPKKDQPVPVTTLRCPACGYLESYDPRRHFWPIGTEFTYQPHLNTTIPPTMGPARIPSICKSDLRFKSDSHLYRLPNRNDSASGKRRAQADSW